MNKLTKYELQALNALLKKVEESGDMRIPALSVVHEVRKYVALALVDEEAKGASQNS